MLRIVAAPRLVRTGEAVARLAKMSKSTFTVGATGSASVVVSAENTALAMGSGSLEVYATPALVALMEKAACNAIASSLAPGETTVGTKMDTSHLSATPLGCTCTAEAKLTGAEGRVINFQACVP